MDFTIVGGLITVLLVAIPAIGAFFQRQARVQRKENRQLRAIVQEFDLHLFVLEREGFTARGIRAPERPKLLQALTADDDTDSSASARPAAGPEPGTGSGPRHGVG